MQTSQLSLFNSETQAGWLSYSSLSHIYVTNIFQVILLYPDDDHADDDDHGSVVYISVAACMSTIAVHCIYGFTLYARDVGVYASLHCVATRKC